jgi:uncharacterized protein
MPNPSRRLKQLENELLALGDEVMLLEELDGFIAGILVCPEVVPPSEWLPVVWGQTESENDPVFDNLAHMNKMLTLVTEHYNDLARKLFERPNRMRLFSLSITATATFSGSSGSKDSRRP